MDATNKQHDSKMIQEFVEQIMTTSSFTKERAVREAMDSYKMATIVYDGNDAELIMDFDDDDTIEYKKGLLSVYAQRVSVMSAAMRLNRTGVKVCDANTVLKCQFKLLSKYKWVVVLTNISLDEHKADVKESGKENFHEMCRGCKEIKSLAQMKCCSICKKIRYCSVECQKADWKHHKQMYH